MAIDSSLFAATIPAATYTTGDIIPMGCIRGPAIVRDGYGHAKLKRFITITNAASASFVVRVKNSNWVDSMSNPALGVSETTFGNESGAVQSGQDAPLTPNSGWEVTAVCIAGGTEANAADIACIIDVDYPSVAAVQDPKAVQGFPVTIEDNYTHTITAKGALASAPVWATFNVDFLKAGSKYLLTEASFKDSGSSTFGFISLSGAAGQSGLERIIPVRAGSAAGLRYSLDYSTPLVKGPMNINILSVGTAGTSSAYTYFDFVKKSV